MSTKKIIGIVLAVVGVGLAYWGYHLSGSVGSQLNQAFSGSPTDKVMAFYIGAGVSLAAALFLLLKK